MAQRPVTSPPRNETVRVLDGGFWMVVVMAVILVVLVVATVARGVLVPDAAQPGAAAASPTPVDLASFIYPAPREAPPIQLTDSDSEPLSLASLRGEPVFVFFGYTHCPDVCPATTGAVGLAMDAFGKGTRAMFVTIDPERDTTTWLKEYVRFLHTGFVAVTGNDQEIRSTADAWSVRYARAETGVDGGYAMSHTADVYLVDAKGLLRAHFPFGTESETMTAVLRKVVDTPSQPVGAAVPSTASPGPVVSMDVRVVSSSVWAGIPGPVILVLSVDGLELVDPTLHPTVQLVGSAGEPIGEAVVATPVQPPGVTLVSYVANLAIPAPGEWRMAIVATRPGATMTATAKLTALDPGTTAPLGAPAPGVRTPTLGDFGGNAQMVTTDPAPDVRLSERSTADALADGQPFVLVVDSAKFKVSAACGRALIMARYLADRWREIGFIHLEPYRYSIVSDTPVLTGSLADPQLTDVSAAWGVGGAPWGPRTVPWVFVVDGHGIVRAKYQGVFGTADLDVMIALIAQGD